MMKNWKVWLPDVLMVVLFVAISLAYFFPADMEGRILYRHDSAAFSSLAREQDDYFKKHGERTRWINHVFSGMPT
jgi:hypothetical protein